MSTMRKPILQSILFAAVFTLLFMGLAFVKAMFPVLPERWMHAVMGTVAAVVTTVVFLRWQGLRWSDIHLRMDRATPLRFGIGMALGLLVMGSLAFGVMRIAAVELVPNPDSSVGHFLLSSLYLLPLAYLEELAFRGFPLEVLRGRTNTWLALGLTSLLFALYHVASGWSWASAFYGPFIWGLIFGVAALQYKGIAMPTGWHYAGNLATSAIGASANPQSIWLMQETPATEAAKSSIWITLGPVLVLLIIAVAWISVYQRREGDGGRLQRSSSPA